MVVPNILANMIDLLSEKKVIANYEGLKLNFQRALYYLRKRGLKNEH